MRCDEGKTRYATHSDAIKVIIYANFRAWRRGKTPKLPVRAYRCPICGNWHVTSQKPQPRRRKRGPAPDAP